MLQLYCSQKVTQVLIIFHTYVWSGLTEFERCSHSLSFRALNTDQEPPGPTATNLLSEYCNLCSSKIFLGPLAALCNASEWVCCC